MILGLKNMAGKVGVFMLTVLAALSGLGLFFEDQFTVLASLVSFDRFGESDGSGEILRIAYLFPAESLNPFANDPAIRNRLNDVYEPLVRPDRNMIIQPALAVSYGLLTEREWLFTLRRGVLFHNGRELRVEDVIFSFNQAKARPGSVADDLVNEVVSVERAGDYGLIIKTRVPDPLLLTRLSRLPIVPEGYDDFENPVGTGPYRVQDGSDLDQIKYVRFKDYWGEKPYFGRVEVLSQPDRNLRLPGLLEGKFDFLVDVPPDAVEEIKLRDFQVKLMPSLEVGFVVFNLQNKNFAQKTLREAVARAVNKKTFLDLAYGYAMEINQFVPSGVFGYNPEIEVLQYDPATSAELIDKMVSGFEKLQLDFYFPQNLRLLGQYFSEQLAPVGINLRLFPLTDQQLQEKLSEGNLGFYYLGWRHDSGDALPFLKAVIHSRTGEGYGLYNGSAYQNNEVDRLIEKSETNFNESERLSDLQTVMRMAVQEDLIGVPLFESMSIFAYRPGLEYRPRVDSLVFPSDISNSSQ